jgi:hypothetical protein
VGDAVYSRSRDRRIGTFAEFIAVNEADVALKPKNLNMTQAAAIPLVGLTAWQALVEVGKVKPGERSSFRQARAALEQLLSNWCKSRNDDEREECRIGQKSRDRRDY